MKKYAALFLLLYVLLMCSPVIALAEAVTGDTPLAYTWEMLGTIAGATAATLLIVQYLKSMIDQIVHVPTRLLALVVALMLLLGAHAFTTGITWSDVPLILVNAFVVALAAMGAYENTFGRPDTDGKNSV